jgi:acyl dehydratase
MKYWEDFQIGERAELGRHTFTEDEIVEFGRRYDPQPFISMSRSASRARSAG